MASSLAVRASLHLAHAQRHSLRESVEFAQLLAMDSIQVDATVAAELATNPALVRSERRHCAGCGIRTRSALCPTCRSGARDGLTTDPVAPTGGIREQVLRDLLTTCRGTRERTVAQHLVASLDRSGFLTEPTAALATRLGVTSDVVEDVRRRLQAVGPAGIAVNDVRERLLALVAESPVTAPPEMAAVLDADPGSLVDDERPEAARCLAWLREHIDPRLDLDPPGPAEARRPPDLLVVDDQGNLTVRPWGLAREELEVDPEFAALGRTDCPTLAGAELARVRAQVARARALVARLEGRTRTVVRVAQAVVDRQQAYIRAGARAHQPMTRAGLAAELELHESTVGRAVSGTTLLLPDRSVRELASFFGGRQAVLAELARLLLDLPQATDRALADGLADRGFPVARRTVSKYRQVLTANTGSPGPSIDRS